VVARPNSTSWLFALLAALASGCASGPAASGAPEVLANQRTLVRYVQFGSGQILSLQNASSGTKAEVYSDPQRDRMVKVIGDGELQALIQIFGDYGMFRAGAATASVDARECLVVETPARRWVWARRRGPGVEDPDFHQARSIFLSLYNASVAYHGDQSGPAPDLASQQQRIQQDAAAARERLLRLGRSQ
jgi:hypothetical protein